jgi:hypothetical protein
MHGRVKNLIGFVYITVILPTSEPSLISKQLLCAFVALCDPTPFPDLG